MLLMTTSDAPVSLRCRGMRDLSPQDMARFQRIVETFRRWSGGFGYGEIRTPVLEYLHLFTAAGTLSPRMLSRVYSFLDWDGWSGERVVLRPDATIPVVRYYSEHYEAGEPAKFSYIENVFRFAEGDESREDWQCGLENIGGQTPTADIELIHVAQQVLRELGIGDVEVRLSHAGLVRAVLAKTGLPPEQQAVLNDRLLDGDPTVVQEIQSHLAAGDSPLPLLFESEGENSSFLVNLAALFDAGFPELRGPLNDLKPIAETLEGLGYGLRISAMLVRNFEYYTGPVFQLWSGQRQLGAGGRYDDLVRLSGAAPVPASGIALDLQALLDILGDQDGQSTYRSIAVVASGGSPDQMAMAFQTASRLVEKGWQAHVSTESNGADQAGWRLLIDRADAALIFRVHDIEGGSWRVFRDLDSAIAHLAGAAS